MKTLRRKRVENREDAYEIMVGDVDERLGDPVGGVTFRRVALTLNFSAWKKNTVLLM